MSLLDVFAAQAGPSSQPLIQAPSTARRTLHDRAGGGGCPGFVVEPHRLTP
jgi:hypothetical protein